MQNDRKITKEKTNIVTKVKRILFKSRGRKIAVVIILLVLIFIGWRMFGAKKQSAQYQTAKVEKGTLIVSVSESGQVAVSNRASVITSASGVISEVDVKNGDTVSAGDEIAVVSLDQSGQQRQSQAYSSYLSAQSSLNSANAQLYSLQSAMYSKWSTYINIAQNSSFQNPDGSANNANRTLPQFTISQDDWLAAEAGYKNQQGVIAQNQIALNNAWLNYQAASSIISAPSAGTISDLIIAPGMQIGSLATSATTSTSSTSNSSSSQFIASIKTEGNPVITISLSEIDVTKVKAGQKATITFDALTNKTFTGKVVGINTTGTVSSGVTTYPANIVLDTPNDSILPNMSATANIIIKIKNDALLVPSGAVQTTGGQATVRTLENGQIVNVPIEIGESSDTQTEILSGISEEEVVGIGFVSTSETRSSSSSPFSGGLRVGGFGGSGAVRSTTGR